MNERIIQIVGKNVAGVETTLGKIESSHFVKPGNTACKEFGCLKGYFDKGRYEIVFIGGVADWITINNTDSLAIDEFISSWGLQELKPDFANHDIVLRYYNILGMNEVSLFNDGSDNVGHIYIKAFTN